MQILLVGGAVRDLLLGKKPHDFDFLIAEGSAEEFLEKHPSAQTVGKSYEIFYVNGQEFSMPRHKGRTADENITLDLASRDFTINSFAMNDEGELFCHENGLEDMINKTLRPCSENCFRDDPLRVFRAATFMSRFPEFTPHPQLISGMQETAQSGLLAEIAPDRIGVEVRKAMNAEKPGNFLLLLSRTNCLRPWFKEFEQADEIPAGPPKYHDKSVLGHIAEVMDKTSGNPLTCWMAMCHDLGKVTTDPRRLPAHHGHDARGKNPAKQLGQRILLPNKFIQAGELGAELHMKAGNYRILRPGTRVDLLMKLHTCNLLENMRQLTLADRGEDVMFSSNKELAEILKVSLPVEARNLGKKSGNKLRALRAESLKRFSSENN